MLDQTECAAVFFVQYFYFQDRRAGERSRFKRELERLAQLPHALIVIEADLATLCGYHPAGLRSGPRVTTSHAVGSLLSWSVRYGIPHVFISNRLLAARYALRWLIACHRGAQREDQVQEEASAAAS